MNDLKAAVDRLEEIRVDTSNIERNLTNVIVQYKDKFISTGALNPGAMAEDCLRVIRELQADIDRLAAERDAALRMAEAAVYFRKQIDGDNQRFEAAVEEAIRHGFITEQLAMPEPGGEVEG